MNLKKDIILNNNLNILKTIKNQNNYFVYSAMNSQNGNIYYITEYFPDEGVRNDDGVFVIPYESMKVFDICVNNLITDADIVISLEINNYLKVITSFNQIGTGYVVTEKIEGNTFEALLDKKKSPLTIDEATPVFIEFLRAVADAASNHSIYFYIDPSTVYVTDEGRIRINYFYANNYDEKSAVADIAKLYYFILNGSIPSEGPFYINTDGLPKNHQDLISVVTKECTDENFESMRAFYDELLLIYSDKKAQTSTDDEKPKTNLKAGLIAISVLFGFITVIALSSFFISKLILGDPLSPPKTNRIDADASSPNANREIEFDID